MHQGLLDNVRWIDPRCQTRIHADGDHSAESITATGKQFACGTLVARGGPREDVVGS
jgi:hypothetical protein